MFNPKSNYYKNKWKTQNHQPNRLGPDKEKLCNELREKGIADIGQYNLNMVALNTRRVITAPEFKTRFTEAHIVELKEIIDACGGHDYAYWLSPREDKLRSDWWICCQDNNEKKYIFKVPGYTFSRDLFRNYQDNNAKDAIYKFEFIIQIDENKNIYKCYGKDIENPIDLYGFLYVIVDGKYQLLLDNRQGWNPYPTLPDLVGPQPISASERPADTDSLTWIENKITQAKKREFHFTDEQKAVVTYDYKDKDSALVVASAGCGKSTTLLGHAMYLMEEGKIANSDEILFIVFNRKNREDLQELLNSYQRPECTNSVHTFHSLGCQIIYEAGDSRTAVDPDAPKEDNPLVKILDEYISGQRGDREWIKNLWRVGTNLPEVNTKEGSIYDKLVQDPGQRGILEQLENAGRSLMEKCRIRDDKDRLRINNFLILMGLENRLFPQYPTKKIIINRNEKTRDMCAIYWGDKPTRMEENDLFIHSFNNGFDELEQHLKELNIPLKPIDSNELSFRISQTILKARCSKFEEKARFFTTVFKIKYPHGTEDDFESIRLELLKKYADERAQIIHINAFFDLIIPVYLDYEKELDESHKLDFNDMLNDAIQYIKKERVKRSYKYILVDEFQDVAKDNFELVDALQKQTHAKVMCVGDDWQSIYSWRGSDLKYFEKFETYFPNSEEFFINETFRNSLSIVKTASTFIEKDKNLKKKNASSKVKENTELIPVCYTEKSRQKQWEDLLDKINKKHPNQNIMILGRYNADYKLAGDYKDANDFIENSKKRLDNLSFGDLNKHKNEETSLFSTIHRAKGAESDVIIILNLCGYPMCGTQNFPSTVESDIVLEPLYDNKNIKDKSEERRLFYVAMTRAKKACYLWIPKENPSSFVKELSLDIPLS